MASASFPKFVIHGGYLLHELRKQRGTIKYMILVPLSDLKFIAGLAAELAAYGVWLKSAALAAPTPSRRRRRTLQYTIDRDSLPEM